LKCQQNKGQKLILFERIKSKPVTHESSEDNSEFPQFSYYGPNAVI